MRTLSDWSRGVESEPALDREAGPFVAFYSLRYKKCKAVFYMKKGGLQYRMESRNNFYSLQTRRREQKAYAGATKNRRSLMSSLLERR